MGGALWWGYPWTESQPTFRAFPDRSARDGGRLLLPSRHELRWPVAPVLTYIAVKYDVGIGVAMMVGTTVGPIGSIIALHLGPETNGQVFESDGVVI
jgi:hypothetical protein